MILPNDRLVHNNNMNTKSGGLRALIVGATGAVGEELRHLLEPRSEDYASLDLCASSRSEGKTFPFRGEELPVKDLAKVQFEDYDVAFFSAGASRSREFVPKAAAAGCFVSDNSSAFRMDPNVPLVVPEINGNQITAETRLASVPNCSAIILLMAVHPLMKLAQPERLIVSTYQSASGGGAAMMRQLLEETEYALKGETHPEENSKFPPYAFNVFSHNTPIDETGANEEELKVAAESRRILSMPDLKVNVTCVRVPVLRAHTESVTLEFKGRRPSLSEAKSALEAAPGVRIIDDRERNHFPTPREAAGQGDVLVGRLREDPSNDRALIMLASGDQLLKGAALTAVQIADIWAEKSASKRNSANRPFAKI